ncbi:MAG: sigma-70 family RNA polymerase sigma factor [Planctomycetes bacterium]|nr:sigma-70 family RNA polymerase sigma factor [Planctomycetota bacterium]
MSDLATTIHIQGCLDRLKAGDSKARDEILKLACDRLEDLTRRMVKGYQGVRRWEETGDVFQNAMLRLWKSLDKVAPATALEFFKLAATQIRRELIDLARHHYGPMGDGANHATNSIPKSGGDTLTPVHERAGDLSGEPGRLALWTEFHLQVEKLPEDEREVFDLLWYQGMKQEEAANILGVTTRTIKNRWRSARILLHEALGGELPDS